MLACVCNIYVWFTKARHCPKCLPVLLKDNFFKVVALPVFLFVFTLRGSAMKFLSWR